MENLIMTCQKCGSENISFTEYLGGGDMILTSFCLDCKHIQHRNGMDILAQTTDKNIEYGPQYFILAGKDNFPLRYKNAFPYEKMNEIDDKIFDEMEFNLIT